MRINESRLVQSVVVGTVALTVAIVGALAWSLHEVVGDVRAIRDDVSSLIEAAEIEGQEHAQEATRVFKAMRRTNKFAARQHRRIIDFMRAIVKVAGLNLREIEERARGTDAPQQR